MIKPHLAYWGSPFSWRGEIAFDDGGAVGAILPHLPRVGRGAGGHREGRGCLRRRHRARPHGAAAGGVAGDHRRGSGSDIHAADLLGQLGRVRAGSVLGRARRHRHPVVLPPRRPRGTSRATGAGRGLGAAAESPEAIRGRARTPSRVRRAGLQPIVGGGRSSLGASFRAAQRPKRSSAAVWPRRCGHSSTTTRWSARSSGSGSPARSRRGNFLQSTPAMREVIARFWGPYAVAAVESR